MRLITSDGKRYAIRGTRSAKQLRSDFRAFVSKHQGTKLTFTGWLVGYGHVHSSIKGHQKGNQ